ncbi:MAG: alpha/beta fold hydrolase [Burkholderiales bacterium]|nr:alpha/beta fold hydrolase [Burkholderiales bacterium]
MPTVQVPGCVLHYELLDATLPWLEHTDPIVFYHGLGANAQIWRGWVPMLADGYRMLGFDMRGHGRSSHPPVGAPLSLDLLVDDLFAVADAAGVQRFHLVGESIGGTLALLAALRAPERIRTLTVSNGAHAGGAIGNLDDWQQIIDARGMTGWSEHMMAARFFPETLSQAMYEWYAGMQASVSPDVLLRAVRLLAAADLSAQLPRLSMPVLLLHPDSSPFIPVALMADLKSRLPQSRLQVFAHSRHGLPFSHADDCAEALRQFLDEVDGR